MKALHVLLFAAACGGPTQKDLAETPTATTRPRPAEAPPATTSDLDRTGPTGLIQQFDDMQATQNAHQEARNKTPEPTGPVPAAQPAPPPPGAKKKGVAEQGYLPNKK